MKEVVRRDEAKQVVRRDQVKCTICRVIKEGVQFRHWLFLISLCETCIARSFRLLHRDV